MITAIANLETLPHQIGDEVWGPPDRRKPVSFGASRQQTGELSQLSLVQLRRTARGAPAAQSGGAVTAILLRPLMNGLAAYAELSGDRGQRLAAFDARQGRKASCLECSFIALHAPKIRYPVNMSIYLCKGL
jgi:hypothetical protein